MLRWTEEQYQAHLAKMRGDPVPAQKAAGKIPHEIIRADGFTFQSRGEFTRYGELRWLEKAGTLRNLRVHTPWGLVVNGKKVGVWTDDFSYQTKAGEEWVFVCEDVKSAWTQKDKHYRRAKKLMAACHHIEIQEVIR
jgi:hypothetical protein